MALDERIAHLAHERGLNRVGVFFASLDGGHNFTYNAEDRFHAASTMKVPVLMEAFRQHREGVFDLDGSLLVLNRFTSLADGLPFELDPANDSDPSLYDEIGREVPSRELAERMITRSSNLATNLLVERLGVDRIQSLLASIDAQEMQVLRGVEDNRAYRAGLSNTTTAAALGQILWEIAKGESFTRGERNEMMEILGRQEHLLGIAAGVPGAKRVCSKSGSFTGTFHDAAIVEVDPGYAFVLVVLTQGRDEEQSAPFVASLASIFANREFV